MRPGTSARAVIAAVLLMGVQTTVSAQVTRLDDVPESLDDETRALFQIEHRMLDTDRSDLGRDVKGFEKDCSHVRAGTPEDAACMRSYEVLDGDRRTYSSKVEDFNQRLRGATRDFARGYLDAKSESVWLVPRQIKGDVLFYANGQLVESDGLRLRVDRVVTKANSTFAVELPDGHVIEIGPDSDISLDAKRIDESRPLRVRLGKWVGSMLVKTGRLVTPGGGRFTIHTTNAILGVRGTEFVLRGEVDESMTLGLIEGEVELLSPETGRATTVRPGDEIRVGEDGEVELTRRSGEQIAEEWARRLGTPES